jgi:EmrB/QacA subfamily drug resistance transporter
MMHAIRSTASTWGGGGGWLASPAVAETSETVSTASTKVTWLPLVAMGLGIFVIANDVTAMSVALPAIERSFDTDVSTVQWVVNAYALIFGVLIVTGGRLADMFGRRRMLFVGAAVFAAFSLLGGLAPNVGALIACRALMGIGGALMWPAILGLVYAILPSDKAGLAGGLVIGTAGLGNAAGPLLGGLLAGSVGWRWILLLNVPIAGLACLVTWLTVPASAGGARGRIDYAGIATISVGLVSLLIALDAGPDAGWTSPTVVGAFVLAVVLVGTFVVVERRAGDEALVPPAVMRNLGFTSACLATLLMSSTFFAALLYLPQYFQKILGHSALGAGAGLLPLMAVFAATSFLAGPLYNRLGAKMAVSAGALGMAVGPFLFTFLGASGGYAALVPGMIVMGVGVGLFYSSVTTAGVTALDESQSSLAGGILYMFQLAGGSVGLALTTTVFLGASNRALDHDAASIGASFSTADRTAVRGVLAGTDSAAAIVARFPGAAGDKLVEVVRDAFSTGFRWAFRLDAILALVGFAVAVAFVGGRLRDRGDPDEVEPGCAPTAGGG